MRPEPGPLSGFTGNARTLQAPRSFSCTKGNERVRGGERQGLVFVVSSPSGGGKTSLVTRVLKELSGLERSVSCTTRPVRPGEKNEVDYIFLERSEFERAVGEGRFLEWAEVYGNLYGTPKEPIERNRTGGVDTILAIEIQGARSIRRAYPKAITIFIQPPSLEVLEQRLRDRGSDPEKTVEKRLSQAQIEMDWIDEYRYAIVNDEFDRTVGDLKAIITAERCRVRPAPDGLST